jgi:hypothetical protein
MTTTCCWAFGALFLSAVCGRKFVAYRKKWIMRFERVSTSKLEDTEAPFHGYGPEATCCPTSTLETVHGFRI